VCVHRASPVAVVAVRFLKQPSPAFTLVQASRRCVVGLWVVAEHVERPERPRGKNRILLTVVHLIANANLRYGAGQESILISVRLIWLCSNWVINWLLPTVRRFHLGRQCDQRSRECPFCLLPHRSQAPISSAAQCL